MMKTNDDSDSEMNVLLLLSDMVYSMRHQPCGIITDAGFADNQKRNG